MGAVPTKRATGTQAVDRAADLLVDVLNSSIPVTFSQLTMNSGLAKGTASRLISALERKGLLLRNKIGEIEVGSVLNKFALKISPISNLVDKLQPYLEFIGNNTGETASIAIAGNEAVENIAQIDAKFLLSSRNWVGQKVPYHASAAGKVLLAFQVANVSSGKLEKLTSKTITNPSVLQAELEKVRLNGYAIIIDELEVGLVAISVPVRNEKSKVVAALSVSGPSTRLNANRIKEVTNLLQSQIKKFELNTFDQKNNKRGAA
jgi:DNA-binding IclR family transcriptional regulator